MLISRGTAPEQPSNGSITPKWPNELLRILFFFYKIREC